MHPREWFHARSARRKGRSHLPLLAQQSHWRGGNTGAPRDLGAFRARARGIILYDAAYEAYIAAPDIPHSIYEIPGARKCAIEFRSFSKNGGFTGVRCAFTVVPNEIECQGSQAEKLPLRPLWNRRFSTKFNGVSYVTQRAAEALYSPEGKSQVASLVSHYMGNAKILREAVTSSGLAVYGGVMRPISGCAVRHTPRAGRYSIVF